MFFYLDEDFSHGHLGTFRIPRGIRRVAPAAAQVATRAANEARGHAGEPTLALNGEENFGDPHGDKGSSFKGTGSRTEDTEADQPMVFLIARRRENVKIS